MYFPEVFQYPINEFKKHLTMDGNERIIFSGRYGSGKTTFLRDIFSPENQQKIFDGAEYEVFYLFPVNYSIASNEDIMRYIKYDIIIEMLKREASVEDVKKDIEGTIPHFVAKNIDKLLLELVRMIPKLGKGLVETLENIEGLKEKYEKSLETKTDGDHLIEYIESEENRKGSLYENDLIAAIVKKTNSKLERKQSVLVMDDLDRLDPEHVFRILNVFASQFDTQSTGFKRFGFSKIILVSDFRNIRNIFHHRYGVEVDFNGYIDKFYTYDVYRFDNRKAIVKVIEKITRSVKIESKGGNDREPLMSFYFFDGFVEQIICRLIEQDLISLRSIMKMAGREIGYHYEEPQYKRNRRVPAWQIQPAIQLKYLCQLFGDYTHFEQAISRLHITADFLEDYNRKFGQFIYVANLSNHYNQEGTHLVQFDGYKGVLYIEHESGTHQIKTASLYRVKEEERVGNQQPVGSTVSGMGLQLEKKHATPEPGSPFEINAVRLKKAMIEAVEYLHAIDYL